MVFMAFDWLSPPSLHLSSSLSLYCFYYVFFILILLLFPCVPFVEFQLCLCVFHFLVANADDTYNVVDIEDMKSRTKKNINKLLNV